VETDCFLAYVRSATPPFTIDVSSCQPFAGERFLFLHNGFIHNFRETLYRSLRELLSDDIYRSLEGMTDSEHIFALFLNEWREAAVPSPEIALESVLRQLTGLARKACTYYSANIVLGDGKRLVASRYANRHPAPTLYWLRDAPDYPDAVIVASEPLFAGDWKSFPENSLLRVGADLEVTIRPIA
jgi:glutamine amidotransferase